MRSIRLLCRLLMRTVWASLVGACMAAAPVAIAGDGVASRLGQLDLADLLDIDIQTASRFSQKRSEAPSSVTVIMADEIRAHGYERLSEILNSVRGLYAYTDRLYEFAGVRGSCCRSGRRHSPRRSPSPPAASAAGSSAPTR